MIKQECIGIPERKTYCFFLMFRVSERAVFESYGIPSIFFGTLNMITVFTIESSSIFETLYSV